MLKLKYLFDNKDLAKMILENWEYDKNDPNLLEYFRISANAIYWCKHEGRTFILRFAPVSEKSEPAILAELDFLRYLHANGYSSSRTILSKSGNEFEKIITPWGDYLACAFEKAPGMELSRMEISEEKAYECGKVLGKLHRLSSQYAPEAGIGRETWHDRLKWIEEVLVSYDGDSKALMELSLIRNFLANLTVTSENFGLIHYDFEPDNLFYEEQTHLVTAIDFDDAIYFWYAADLCIALDALRDELPEEQRELAVSRCIEGYRTEHAITEEELKLYDVFHRFACLYGYARIVNATHETWKNEPEWMSDLRATLGNSLRRRSLSFGNPLK